MNKLEILIIDSGVNLNHPLFKDDQLKGFQFCCKNASSVNLNDKNIDDSFGHGTAVYGIIRKTKDFANITNIKIPDIENGNLYDQSLFEILEYIFENINSYHPDIINLSLGINMSENLKRLYYICSKLYDKGVVIVSAFDNAGAISYPAAFDCVIGVTSSKESRMSNEFTYIEDTIVNIAAFGNIQRLAWSSPDYIMMGGNSFACAHVTVQVARYMQKNITTFQGILKEFKDHAVKSYIPSSSTPLRTRIFTEKRAVVFPFNKEIHSLIRFPNLLNFKIVDVYDSKYSARVGATTRHILSDENVENYLIGAM